jgi:hypothetical protein|tara:strand:+ start:399 stop:578 length:180 start_codon:yes stop_codon:yes gene_type:complete
MAKAMRVPVLIFENIEEVKIIMKALHHRQEHKKDNPIKIQGILNEIYKIKEIIEKANHS